MATVDYAEIGDIAIIELNHPPVNALSTSVRDQIIRRIKEANSSPNVRAIVICGKGRQFCAGADVKEFSSRRETGGSNLEQPQRIDDAIEGSGKPVVSAIHGTALGGGLEVALSSHYRVAVKSSRLGLPEVLIGILPGLGGTQRLPRLVGLEKAIDIITTGRHVRVKEALQIGLIDKIIDGKDAKVEGIKFARTIVGSPISGRTTSRRPVPDAANYETIIGEALKKAKRKYRGLQAPLSAIQAVAGSVTSNSFQAGIRREQELFADLFTSEQALGLQYAFFAQRAAPKWEIPGGASYKTVRPKPFKTGAVIGGGTMGSGIAMAMLNAQIPVTLVEQNQKFLDKGVENIKKLYAGSVKLGLLTSQQADYLMSLLTPTTKYTDLRDVDLIVEAVFENMALKKKIFAELDRVCKPNALLCSNTSSLNIDEIASATRRPDKVIGAHFFVPAYYMKVLEVVRGEKTSPETIATCFAYATKIGKVPALVGNCHGFVGNRMFAPFTTEARFIVEEGLLPHEVDAPMEEFGFPMGPMKVSDLSGIDIGVNIKKELCKVNGVAYDPRAMVLGGSRNSPIVDILFEHGRFGRKSGKGWYKYSRPGAKDAQVDPEVTDIISSFCKEKGIHRRQIPKQEVLERCMYSLINEGFKVLEEGKASKPEDIDIIFLLGYGWPRQTGGPMFYASRVGLREVYEKVTKYYKLFPNSSYWRPSGLLQHLATTSPDAPMSAWRRQASKL